MSNGCDRISVVYATDERFWVPLYVSLFSLLESNRDSFFRFYIISDSEESSFNENIEHLRKTFDFELVYVNVDRSLFAKFPVRAHFSPANYYRLSMGSLLPKTLSRVCYIDCDTLVRKPLDRLFGCDLDSYVLGAVCDVAPIGEHICIPYFNSGVLVINLDLWRSEHIEQRALDFISTYPETIKFADQDALNAVLVNRWKALPSDLNFQSLHSILYPRGTRIIDPALIHYTGSEKPWLYTSRHSYTPDFQETLRRTPYRNYQSDRTWKNILRRWDVLGLLDVPRRVRKLTHPFRRKAAESIAATLRALRKAA